MNIIYKIDIVSVLIIIPILIGCISKPDDWYFNLKKPKLTPPGYVFGIAWSILYTLIAISYYLALWDKPFEYWIIPIIHLLLNYSYTPLIFVYKRLLESAIITSLVLLTAIIVMILFYKYGNMISVYLLIPYILWLSFANYLAWSIYKLNK
jgi:benzodiazapine receptor